MNLRLFSRRPRARALLLVVAVVFSGVALGPAPAGTAAVAARSLPGPQLIAIDDAGFDPASVSLVAGQTVQFDNLAARPVTVRAATGAFDSGAIPPGGSYSLVVPVTGSYAYRSPELDRGGVLDVGLLDLPGAAGDLVATNLPDLPTPLDETFDVHPTLTIHASRTRALVLFAPDATVAQANDAIAAAGVAVVGTLPEIGVVMVAVPDQGPGVFDAIDAAVDSLRAAAGVEAAALSTPAETEAIPQPPEDPMVTRGQDNWQWRQVSHVDNRSARGDGGNWGLESARFPFAWNVNDLVYAADPKVQTAVVDQGFDGHPDLGGTPVNLCRGIGTVVCNANGPTDHGTHVAGTIGARWDNTGADHRSVGVSGGNPVADLRLVPWGRFDTTVLISNVLAEKKAGGKLPELRVINFSGTNNALARDPAPAGSPPGSTGPASWGRVWAGLLCGPGEFDDAALRSVPCTPDTEDAALTHAAELGAIDRAVAQVAAARDVLIVKAAGNDSDEICGPPVAQPPCTGTAKFVVLDARRREPFGWASSHWTSARPNPIILVEAVDELRRRAEFSNVGGDVSAAGVDVLSLAPASANPSRYQTLSGTSMAAPHVSALAGYLLAYQPSLTTAQVKALIVDHARADTSQGAKPRIDAYSSLLSAPGAAKAIVDVNDPSVDGNRRVVRADDGAESLDTVSGNGRFGKPTYTEPDGHVDLRDVRRFRDAYLERCIAFPQSGCPQPADVVLDGGPFHPKQDLNLDRCVYSPDPARQCTQTIEPVFSRFDFNGDGFVGPTPYPVPLNTDGTPTASGDGAPVSDLDLLTKFFETEPNLTEGWTKDDIPALITSADVEVHAEPFFKAGVDSVKVTVESDRTGDWVAGPTRTLTPTSGTTGVLVASQPTGPIGSRIRVSGEATLGTETLRSAPVILDMKPGQDARVDLCVPQVLVTPDDSTLFTGGDPVKVRLKLALCPSGVGGSSKPGPHELNLSVWEATPPAPAPVTNGTTSGGADAAGDPAHATLSTDKVVTNEDGEAVVELAPSADPENIRLEARSILADAGTPDPIVAVGTAPVGIADPPRLLYRYEQVTTDWNYEEHYVRDTDTGPATIDITEEPGALPYRTERSGALTPTGSGGAKVTETVSGDDLRLEVTAANSKTGTTTKSWRTFLFPKQTTITDADVSHPNVVIDSIGPNGLPRSDYYWVGGVFSEVAEGGESVAFWQLEDLDGLDYPYTTQEWSTPVDPNGTCAGVCGYPHEDQLLFLEREVRSGFRYSPLVEDSVGPGGLTRVLNFTRDDTGWSAPYTYCEPVRTYPMRGLDAGDFLGTGSGSATSKFRFVAAIATSDDQQASDLTLPDCDAAAAPPVALFDPSNRHPEEGRIVEMSDLSTGNLTAWHWDFGDGTTSDEQEPTHKWEDNGSYDVTLTVTDDQGRTDQETIAIDVRNAPPEISADDVSVASKDDPVTVEVRLTDPGHRDGEGLQLEANWDTPGFGLPTPLTTTVAAGATQRYELGTLPFGSYQLRFKVKDKDGGEASTTVQVSVGVSGTVEPEDNVDSEAAPACDFGISLGVPENDTIELLNGYRAASKLAPVYASPTLTKAAEAHAKWMADNGTLSHIGAASSTPKDRATAAGYPAAYAVGENVAYTGPDAIDAVFGWRNSPVHNTNMLRPMWRAIGVARVVTPAGSYWVHLFGDTVDCPLEPPGLPNATASAASAASAGSATSGRGATSVAAAPAGPGTPGAGAGTPAAPRYGSWGPGGQEGEPLDAPVQTGGPLFRPGEHPFIPPDQPPVVFPPLPTGSPPPGATFTGLVVSRAAPDAGTPFTVTNRTMRDGALAAATLTVDDGRAPLSTPPGATATFTVVTPGPLGLVLTPDTGSPVSRTLAVGGTPVVATVAYQGDVAGAERSLAHLSARVTAGGAGVAARTVTFTLGALSASAVTGNDGTAEASLRLDVPAGPYTLKVDVAATARDPAVSATTGFLVEPHVPPTADAGGPYTSLLFDPLALDASGSTTSVAGGLAGRWDLDGDGAFDDADGIVVAVPWEDVQSSMCGGTCVRGTPYPIAVEVTDARGATDTAASTVELTSTFALAVDPPGATLNPGGSSSFTVSVNSQSGWDQPVHLSTVGLPAGVTATFSENDKAPDVAVTLTLTAASDATAIDDDFVVRAESDGVVRETGRSVDLEFGLVPACYGKVTGRVLDAETGLPLAGAGVNSLVRTAADGTFVIEPVPLGPGNTPIFLSIYATADGYQGASVQRTVGCGNPVDVVLRLAPRQTSSISGHIVVGTPDPFDRSATRAVTPTATPIAGIQISAQSSVPDGSKYTTSADDGSYLLDQVALAPGNLPASYYLSAGGLGYWAANASLTVSPGSPQTQDLALVPICRGSIDVRVVDQETGRPLVGVFAGVDTEAGSSTGTTDANGRVHLENVALGRNNSTVTRFVRSSAVFNGQYVGASQEVVLATCGATGFADLTLRAPVPRRGGATGRVVDEQTGAPLAGMTVTLNGNQSANATTDADGRYRFDDVLLGYDDQTTSSVSFRAVDNRFNGIDRYESSAYVAVTMRAGETVGVADLTMLRVRYGTITGVVLDAVTGEPIAGAAVGGAGSALTGPDGRFRFEKVVLGPRNTPTGAFIGASREGYWPKTTSVTVGPDEPAETELRLLRACAPASVRGRVINAATKEPLFQAGVKYGPNISDVVFTDVDGRYEVPAIKVPQNRPFETTLLAYKEGFLSQSRSITIQCGARLTVDFAGPIESSASVHGTVTEAATGLPVAGAPVLGEWGGSAVTAADGTYRIDDVPLASDGSARTWSLFAQPPELSPLAGASTTFTAEADTDTRADLALAGPTNQVPVAQSQTITAVAGASGSVQLAATDPDGDPLTFFRVGSVPPWISWSYDNTQLFYTVPAEGAPTTVASFLVSDGKADSEVATVTIQVPVNPPTAVIAPVAPANEGDTVMLDGTGSTPSPGATLTAYDWDLDSDGAYDDASGATPSWTIADDGYPTARLRVTDSAGYTATASRDVAVFNVVPVVDAGDFETVGADGGFGRTVTFTDPGDDTWTAYVDWDGPTGTDLPDIIPLTTRSFPIAHTFPGPGTYPVSVRVCEGYQVCGEDAFVVAVPGDGENRPPTAVIAPIGPQAEGGALLLDGSASTDPDGPIATYDWDLDGDGSYDDAVGATTTFGVPDDGTFTVRLRVADDQGATAVDEAQVVVTNVAPTVDLGPDATVDVGSPLGRTAAVVDPGADDLTATIDLDDGLGPHAVVVTGRAFDWSATFAAAGTFDVTAEVCDEQACGRDELTIEVAPPPTTTTTTTTSTTTTTTTSTTSTTSTTLPGSTSTTTSTASTTTTPTSTSSTSSTSTSTSSSTTSPGSTTSSTTPDPSSTSSTSSTTSSSPSSTTTTSSPSTDPGSTAPTGTSTTVPGGAIGATDTASVQGTTSTPLPVTGSSTRTLVLGLALVASGLLLVARARRDRTPG